MKKAIIFLCCILSIMILGACEKSKKVNGLKGTVDEIVDGNTIKLANGLKVRLLGIAGSPNSQEYMEQHVLHKRVRLTVDSEDKKKTFKSASKSTVRAYVRLLDEGTCLNLLLLKNRLADINSAYVTDSVHWFKEPLTPNILTIEQVASIARPATFLILTQTEKGIGAGTGFFISKSGLALTNNHVYNGTQKGMIYMYDATGKRIPDYDRELGRIVYTNEKFDFTIFQVRDITEPVPCLSLSNRETKAGEEIVAIGNPQVFNSSKYDFNTQSLVLTGRITKYDSENYMIYHDANVDHGCSGGPIVDKYGQVISLTTNGLGGVLTTTNLNCGVDIRIVRQALDHFGKEYVGK